ncbi:MAG: beta-galactosidase [Chloroflexota bacterium]|nr:MAG: beta-galactosidase [Chloroflexota bacterium]
MEPEEGRYDWSWLDRAIDILGGAGLRIMLGTPTAAPPIWLTRNHPDILRIDANGRRRDHGTRRHYCPSSPTYRQYSQEIVSAMARRYGQHPHIFGWQIDNEWGGGHTARCYCDDCLTAFREWLTDRYGTITSLNRAWGTRFWSQSYMDWSQIRLPGHSIDKPNPSHVLDFYRFSSDSYVAYQKLQLDLVRQYAPEHVVTTNFMGLYYELDQFDLANDHDFVSWDSYPTGNLDRWYQTLYSDALDPAASESSFAYDVGDPYVTGMAHALTYGLKRQPFWVMEQQAGAINWGKVNPGIRPGTTRLWTWHALAEGADTVVYFRWRSTLFAQEQYHSGLLQHDGSAGVGLADLIMLKDEQQQMADIVRQPNAAEVAMLFDFNDLWALEIQPHHHDYGYLKHLFAYYRACQQLGIQVDIIPRSADLNNYRLIVAPTLHNVDEELVNGLGRYVAGGGNLFLGVRSGFKTTSNLVTSQPLPGLLRPLTGATVLVWQTLPEPQGWDLSSDVAGLNGPASYWVEALQPDSESVRTLVYYGSGPYSGHSALVENRLNEGKVYYHGWYPTEAQARSIFGHLADSLALSSVGILPSGLIARQRGDAMILLNFTDSSVSASVAGRYVTVDPRDVKVVPSPA